MTKTPPNVSVISFSPIHQDARVLRQIAYLSQHYSVTVIGYGHLDPLPGANIQMFSIPKPNGLLRHLRALILLLLGRVFPVWSYEAWYWGKTNHQAALELLLQNKPEAIHANEWTALPLAVKASTQTGAKVILDLHEYSPLEGEDHWVWRVLYQSAIDYILKKYVPYVSASVTVNETIAEKYAAEYGFQPLVVMNTPQCSCLPNFKLTNPQQIRLIHHGSAIRDRKLEIMIQAIAAASSHYTLHFILIEGSRGYVAELTALAQRLAPGRVFFYPPVSPAEIVPRLAEFDIGIYPLPSRYNFNNAAALPNKFFDFITAGLALCIGPSAEMARLTKQFGFGVIAPSFEPEAIAHVLNTLSGTDIDQMKRKAIEARGVLNADVELEKLVKLYAGLPNNRG